MIDLWFINHRDVVQAMLLFIYTDKLPDSMSTNTIQHLFAAADRFGLQRLKQLCEANLCEQVNAETVETTLDFAEKHKCSLLKFVCQILASKNSKGKF